MCLLCNNFCSVVVLLLKWGWCAIEILLTSYSIVTLFICCVWCIWWYTYDYFVRYVVICSNGYIVFVVYYYVLLSYIVYYGVFDRLCVLCFCILLLLMFIVLVIFVVYDICNESSVLLWLLLVPCFVIFHWLYLIVCDGSYCVR